MPARTDRYFASNAPDAALGRTSLRSGAMLMAGRLVNMVVQLGSTVLLARLLGPHDFGLASIVLAMTLFAPVLVDLGSTDATTQRSAITRQQISALFWLNMTVGAALTLAFAGASGFVASLFGQPVLAEIALVSSLTFVLTGLAIQHYALMRRAMEFERIALIDVAANIAGSLVAVAMALAGWSYWALVLKALLVLLLTAAGAWLTCPWMPGRVRIDGDVREMMRFGLGVTGFAITDHLTRSADRLAIGYAYGPGALSYLQNAYLIYSNLISLLAESLHNVAVSGLSKIRDDAIALKRSWASALLVLTSVSSAAFGVLAAVGQDFVVVLLGEKWRPVGPLLCILAMRGIAHAVERTLGWLHVVAARPDRWMKWGLVSAGCQMLALAAGLPFGAIGVVTAYTIVTYLLFVPTLVYAGRPLGIGTRDVIAASGPQVTAGALAGIAGYIVAHAFLADLGALVRIALSATLCMAIYLTILVGLFRVTEPMWLALSLVRDLSQRSGLREHFEAPK